MRIWNVGEGRIEQLYNSRSIVIEANSTMELPDDTAVFLLSKREIRGSGLVQLKEDDNKEERYAQGRLNIYNWNRQLDDDYEKHCEERTSISLKPAPPHEAILKARKIIEEYTKWVEEGKSFKGEIKGVDDKKIVYPCPHCSQEFSVKDLYFEHLRSHKEKDDTGRTGNKSEGEG